MKKISSRKLAEKYFEDHGREFYKQSEIAAFLAGWASRGKADREIVTGEVPNAFGDDTRARDTMEILEEMATLDEQD